MLITVQRLMVWGLFGNGLVWVCGLVCNLFRDRIGVGGNYGNANERYQLRGVLLLLQLHSSI